MPRLIRTAARSKIRLLARKVACPGKGACRGSDHPSPPTHGRRCVAWVVLAVLIAHLRACHTTSVDQSRNGQWLWKRSQDLLLTSIQFLDACYDSYLLGSICTELSFAGDALGVTGAAARLIPFFTPSRVWRTGPGGCGRLPRQAVRWRGGSRPSG
jgi:hypothetical protein